MPDIFDHIHALTQSGVVGMAPVADPPQTAPEPALPKMNVNPDIIAKIKPLPESNIGMTPMVETPSPYTPPKVVSPAPLNAELPAPLTPAQQQQQPGWNTNPPSSAGDYDESNDFYLPYILPQNRPAYIAQRKAAAAENANRMELTVTPPKAPDPLWDRGYVHHGNNLASIKGANGQDVIYERINPNTYRNIRNPNEIRPAWEVEGQKDPSDIQQFNGKMVDTHERHKMGVLEAAEAGNWQGIGKIVSAFDPKNPMKLSEDEKRGLEASGILSRTAGQAGEFLPVVAGNVLAPGSGTTIMVGQGIGSAREEGQEKGWTPKQTAGVAAARAMTYYLLSKVPGSKGFQSIPANVVEGTLKTALLNIGAAGVEAEIQKRLGIQSPGAWETIKQQAASGDQWALATIFGAAHAITAAGNPENQRPLDLRGGDPRLNEQMRLQHQAITDHGELLPEQGQQLPISGKVQGQQIPIEGQTQGQQFSIEGKPQGQQGPIPQPIPKGDIFDQIHQQAQGKNAEAIPAASVENTAPPETKPAQTTSVPPKPAESQPEAQKPHEIIAQGLRELADKLDGKKSEPDYSTMPPKDLLSAARSGNDVAVEVAKSRGLAEFKQKQQRITTKTKWTNTPDHGTVPPEETKKNYENANQKIVEQGGKLDNESESGSRYYTMPDGQKIRVSDHAPNEATQQWIDRNDVIEIRADKRGWENGLTEPELTNPNEQVKGNPASAEEKKKRTSIEPWQMTRDEWNDKFSSRMAGSEDEYVSASTITPPHEVRDKSKYDLLTSDMEKNGWKGRPILVAKYGDMTSALTGSHRIASAKKAGIEIPVIHIDKKKLQKWLEKDEGNIDRFFDRYGTVRIDDSAGDMIRMLKEIGDLRAFKLYADELRANEKHEILIQNALQNGKPVPPEVLKDYPDLQKKSPETTQEYRFANTEEAQSSAEPAPYAPEGARKIPGFENKDAADRRRVLIQKRINDGQRITRSMLRPFEGEKWADEYIANMSPAKKVADDAMSKRRGELENQLRDMVAKEIGTDAIKHLPEPMKMRIMRNEASPGMGVPLDEAKEYVSQLPDDHPAQFVLNNLKELEKNPRGTKIQKVHTDDVQDGTRVQVNDGEIVTINKEDGMLEDGVTAPIPADGLTVYGKKVLPPEQGPKDLGDFTPQEKDVNLSKQTHLFRKDENGNPLEVGELTGKQGGLFGDTTKPTETAPERIGSKEANNPANTAEMFGKEGLAGFDKMEADAKARLEARRIERAKTQSEAGRQRGSAGSLDPQDFVDYAIIGAAKIGKGVRKINDWAAKMRESVGEAWDSLTRKNIAELWKHARRIAILKKEGNEDRIGKYITNAFDIPQNKTTGQIIKSNVDKKTIQRAVGEMDVLRIRLGALAKGEKSGIDIGKAREQNRQATKQQGETTIPLSKAIQGQMQASDKALAKGWKGGIEQARGIASEMERITRETLPPGEREPMLRMISQASTMADLNRGIVRLRKVFSDYRDATTDQALTHAIGGKIRPKMEPTGPDKPMNQEMGVKPEKPPLAKTVDPSSMRSDTGHRQAVEGLVRSLRTTGKVVGANHLADFIQKQSDEGRSNLFRDSDLEAIREMGGQYRQSMTPEQRELLTKALQHVQHLNDTYNKAMYGGQVLEQSKVNNEISDGILHRHPNPLPGYKEGTQTEKSLPSRVAGDAQRDLFTLIHSAAGEAGEKYIWKPVVDGESKVLGMTQAAHDKIKAIDDKYKVNDDQRRVMSRDRLDISTGEGYSIKLTSRQRAELLATSMDPEGKLALLKDGFNTVEGRGKTRNTIKLSPEALQTVLDSATPIEREYAKAIHDYHNGPLRDGLNKTSLRLDGQEVADNPNYHPLKRDTSLTRTNARQPKSGYIRSMLEDLNILKERTGGNAPLLIGDAINNFYSHVDKAARYIHLAEPIRNIEMMFSKAEKGTGIGQSLSDHLGDKWMDKIRDYTGIASGMRESRNDTLMKFSRLAKNAVSVGELGGRLSSAITHYLGSGPYLNAFDSAIDKAKFIKYMANPASMFDAKTNAILKKSPYFRNRMEQRPIDFESPSDAGLDKLAKNRFSQTLRSLGDKATIGLRFGDNRDSGNLFKVLLESKSNPGTDPESREAWALQQAEYTVRKYGTSSSPLDNAWIVNQMNNQPGLNIATTFTSKLFKFRNAMDRSIQDWKVDKTSDNAKKLLANVAISTATALMVGANRSFFGSLKQGFPTLSDKGESEKKKNQYIEFASEALDMAVPKLGQAFRMVENMIQGRESGDSDIVANSIHNALKSVIEGIQAANEGSSKKAAFKGIRALTETSKVLGIPLDAPAGYLQGAYRYFTNERSKAIATSHDNYHHMEMTSEERALQNQKDDVIGRMAVPATRDQGQKDLINMKNMGKITSEQAQTMIKVSKMPPLTRSIWHLDAKAAVDSYSVATEKEKDEIRELVLKKITGDSKLDYPAQDKLLAKAGIAPPPNLADQRLYKDLSGVFRIFQQNQKAASEAKDPADAEKFSKIANDAYQFMESKRSNGKTNYYTYKTLENKFKNDKKLNAEPAKIDDMAGMKLEEYKKRIGK